MENLVTVTKIEFLESHVPYHTAVFHYIVLVYLQVRITKIKYNENFAKVFWYLLMNHGFIKENF